MSEAVSRALDVFVAAVLLAVAWPVLAVIALAIRVTMGSPVLFRQRRAGRAGQTFELVKFRTMRNAAPGADGPDTDAARLTRLGRVLRASSLDELPTLVNVLRGDMSLVGPRPPIPEEVARYQRWQRRRLSMKPGLTCLWQISGRNRVDFDRWMEMDLEYIDSWSPLLDLEILVKTIPAVLSGRGAS